MQSVQVTLDIRTQDIPDIVCAPESVGGVGSAFSSDLARELATRLGVQDYLSKPDRVADLRRVLWQRQPSF